MDAQGLSLELHAATSLDVVAGLMERLALANGMTAIAGGMVTGPIARCANPFLFNNWPEDWTRLYAEREFLHKDPLPRWAMVSGAPLSWTGVMSQLPPNDPGHEIFATAKEHGYREGLAVPVRTGSGALGLVSAGGPRSPLTDEEILRLAGLFTLGLQRAEELAAPLNVPLPSPLTVRERECLSLLVQGLSDRQIATALDISHETVRFHLDNARRKLGARSRAQLGAMAAHSVSRSG